MAVGFSLHGPSTSIRERETVVWMDPANNKHILAREDNSILPAHDPTCSSFRKRGGVSLLVWVVGYSYECLRDKNDMLPTESSDPTPCYLPLLHRGIPL